MWNQTYLHEFKSEGGDSLGYLPDYYLNFERKTCCQERARGLQNLKVSKCLLKNEYTGLELRFLNHYGVRIGMFFSNTHKSLIK